MSSHPTQGASYRLIVFDAVEHADPVRALICKATGLHTTDANRWIARMPGIMDWPISQAQVKSLLDGLYDLGIAAEARSVESLPNLHPVRLVHTVACLPEGFRVNGLRGEPIHWIPWEKVEIIDAGLVEQPDEERAVTPPAWVAGMRNGLNAILRRPQIVARRERTLKFEREPVGEVILIRSDPYLAFRLNADALNYKYLGDRLQPSAGENFPLLLADLMKFSRESSLTRSTRQWIESGSESESTFQSDPESPPIYPSSSTLLDHATLALLWNWYRRDRDQADSHGNTPTEF